MWDKVFKGLCAAAGAIAGLFGEWTVTLSILVAVMCIDYITGVLVAVTGNSDKTEHGGLSSKAGFAGIAKKGFIMLIVLLATLLDQAIGNTSRVFQTAATCYYIANEGLSVLENAVRMHIPFPAGLREALEGIRDKSDAQDDSPRE